MYVSKKHQNWIRPLITALVYTKTFQEDFSDQGVRDYSAFCTVPAAIQFYNYVGGHVRTFISSNNCCPVQNYH